MDPWCTSCKEKLRLPNNEPSQFPPTSIDLRNFGMKWGCLVTIPSCSCDTSKEIANMYQRDRRMQFLMGLNKTFESIRNQLLMMEPLPKGRGVSGAKARNQWKKKGTQDKKRQYCTHYNNIGHMREHCFEIHGIEMRRLSERNDAGTFAREDTFEEFDDYADVNNVFRHDHLEEQIYMTPLEGYTVPKGHVYKLRRFLYGLKQASRQWNVEFIAKIEAFEFVQSKHDHCLFTNLLQTFVSIACVCG
ncbi:UNVERIFIED_CONTAM: hypothetical protein Scaly_0574700 [Sesamum calycinum]|uniref:Reverse transcriptase Ty1/copia-type domain-containing protein n=1 Tax=Sesamum calycinum TaxID=2727403 RepID=A0AAW2RRV5_9LAMI